jgi:hypothetical protein
MAWYSGTGKENHKSLWDKPVKDRRKLLQEVLCS